MNTPTVETVARIQYGGSLFEESGLAAFVEGFHVFLFEFPGLTCGWRVTIYETGKSLEIFGATQEDAIEQARAKLEDIQIPRLYEGGLFPNEIPVIVRAEIEIGIPKGDLFRTWATTGRRCAICGGYLPWEKWDPHHRILRSQYKGADMNDWRRLAALHRACHTGPKGVHRGDHAGLCRLRGEVDLPFVETLHPDYTKKDDRKASKLCPVCEHASPKKKGYGPNEEFHKNCFFNQEVFSK